MRLDKYDSCRWYEGQRAKEKLWMMFFHGNKRYVEPERLEQCFNCYITEADDDFNNQFPIKNILVGLQQK